MPRLRRLLPYLRPYRLAFVITLAASLVASVLDGFVLALLIPVTRLLFGAAAPMSGLSFVERIVNGVIDLVVGDGVLKVGWMVAIVIGTVILKNAASYLSSYSSAYIQESVTRDLRSDLFNHVLRMDLGFLQRTRGGSCLPG